MQQPKSPVFYPTIKALRERIHARARLKQYLGTTPTVAIFGSARIDENHAFFKQGTQVGAAVAQEGFAVITGAGPGLMMAANRGAASAGAKSAGCNIKLPFEQKPNSHCKLNVEFADFWSRKITLFEHAHAAIFLPGGTGTLDELFELFTLIQCKKISPMPIILFNRNYWQGLMDWIKTSLISNNTLSSDEFQRLQCIDTIDELTQLLRNAK